MTDIHPNCVRVEVEFYHSWIGANPALFATKLATFQSRYPVAEWQHFIDLSRAGAIRLIANRRKGEYDREKDWLKEIGYSTSL